MSWRWFRRSIGKLKIRALPQRTVVKDIEPIADIQNKTGVGEVYAFIGSSPIRLFSENWDVNTLMGHVEESRCRIAELGLPGNGRHDPLSS